MSYSEVERPSSTRATGLMSLFRSQMTRLGANYRAVAQLIGPQRVLKYTLCAPFFLPLDCCSTHWPAEGTEI